MQHLLAFYKIYVILYIEGIYNFIGLLYSKYYLIGIFIIYLQIRDSLYYA